MEFDVASLAVLAVDYGMQLVLASATLVIGLYVVKIIVGVLGRVFEKSNVDLSLRGFLRSMASMLLKVMVYITALGVLGVEMTSFIAILAAAGLAVGMALSGTLQNFAGGVMILLFRPYKVGDVIEAQGYTGSVKDIQIFVTILNTPDNKTVLIPNGGLANGSMTNYSTQTTRRVDWTFSIAYGDDIDRAYAVLNRLLVADERILKVPEHFIALSELAASSVNIVVRAWVNTADYWAVYYKMNEEVYRAFADEGLSIPFPQMGVHVQKVDS
ncbi:MAG: mechanosensitive ion channel [Pseudohongiella sp.]|nr:mechanosensitive ion channel [Pseudohongiella sp.]